VLQLAMEDVGGRDIAPDGVGETWVE
jgi:hypothetical protein